ncbi:MAG: efflux RND transporter periplasmic adaptor subunit [Loktanella sp.]|jgi:membrane fusion protein, multidrug efflux system|nr:efflux RND transporter periplasmic adaptor subunit [Loktanella sp.]MDO7608479.1 efflux RND transporter periplasmic adaptor subunit [Loktanella sp.]MDO7622460.1 efflux RND transporter periplasmic adaptor subunit [Loktanella sp.]MDO7625918.1 efflux RND transporter periplasmic adaptor subunit [Loktanella sp.]MDO7664464.1 efflux RND transporter periplasmic adaptor subunit [Loktanella sp.]
MSNSNSPQTLDFTNERGATRSTWIALALVIAIIGWMGSSFVFPAQDVDETYPISTDKISLVAVAVSPSTAENVTKFFSAEGQALPDRETSIRAETTGSIREVLVSKGDTVMAGDIIARFDIVQNEADLNRAQEELVRAQREFDNAEALVGRGVATNDRLSQARATLASAQASVTSAQKAFENSEITAAFGGRVEALDVNTGEFVAAGSEIGRIVDNTPLTVTIQVPQQSLRNIVAGAKADVTFITGEELTGTVDFVGTSADAATRTFLAEITVENDDGAVPAGVSAQIRIPIGDTTAHFLSPAILSLGTDGTLGVKTVDADNKVVFTAVTIERAQTDGVWVSGLPDAVDIITIGQGYVNNGETVDPKSETELAEATK